MLMGNLLQVLFAGLKKKKEQVMMDVDYYLLIDWLIDWLMDWWIDGLIGWSVDIVNIVQTRGMMWCKSVVYLASY